MPDKTTAERLIKLARLALNPAAAPGEASNAFQKLRQLTVANEVSLADLLCLLNGHMPGTNADFKMPYGDYEDFALEEIYRLDPYYLDTILRGSPGWPSLRNQILEFCRST